MDLELSWTCFLIFNMEGWVKKPSNSFWSRHYSLGWKWFLRLLSSWDTVESYFNVNNSFQSIASLFWM
jgi:hypothetical protein